MKIQGLAVRGQRLKYHLVVLGISTIIIYLLYVEYNIKIDLDYNSNSEGDNNYDRKIFLKYGSKSYKEYDSKSDTEYHIKSDTEYDRKSVKEYGSKDDEDYRSKSDKEYGSKGDKEYGSKSNEEYGSKSDEDYRSKSDKKYDSKSDKKYGSKGDKEYGSKSDEEYGSKGDEDYRSKSDKKYDSKSDTKVFNLPEDNTGDTTQMPNTDALLNNTGDTTQMPNTDALLNASFHHMLELQSRPLVDGFKEIKGIPVPLYVYDALWVGGHIQIGAIKQRYRKVNNIFCLVLFPAASSGSHDQESNATLVVVPAVIEDLEEHQIRTYIAASFTCQVQNNNTNTERTRSYNRKTAPKLVALATVVKRSWNVLEVLQIVDVSGQRDTVMDHGGKLTAAKIGKQDERQWKKNQVNDSERKKTGFSEECSNTENGYSAYLNKTVGYEVEFTVCTPAMFKDFSKVEALIDKIEMASLLGSGRIVLYNSSISKGVDAVLRKYVQRWEAGCSDIEVVVLPWRLPPLTKIPPRNSRKPQPIEPNENLIHYFGQLAAVNDCLNRYKELSRYIVFSDIDEIITPLNRDNWSQLIAGRDKRYAVFQITSVNMLANVASPAPGLEVIVEKFNSSVLSHTTKNKSTKGKKGSRFKVIVDPKKVSVMGIHGIISGPAAVLEEVPQDEALLFHYRSPLSKYIEHASDTRLVDRFGKKLAQRLKRFHSELG